MAPAVLAALLHGTSAPAVAVAAPNMFDAATAVPANGNATVDVPNKAINWTSRTSVSWTPPVPVEANATYAYTLDFARTSGSALIRLQIGSATVSLSPGPGLTGTLTTGAGDAGGITSFIPTQVAFVGSVSNIVITKQ